MLIFRLVDGDWEVVGDMVVFCDVVLVGQWCVGCYVDGCVFVVDVEEDGVGF